jgi:hypothetical protein
MRRVMVAALDLANHTVHGAVAEILALQRGGKIDEKLVTGSNRQRLGGA